MLRRSLSPAKSFKARGVLEPARCASIPDFQPDWPDLDPYPFQPGGQLVAIFGRFQPYRQRGAFDRHLCRKGDFDARHIFRRPLAETRQLVGTVDGKRKTVFETHLGSPSRLRQAMAQATGDGQSHFQPG